MEATIPSPSLEPSPCLRFLDLPAELRIAIYELVLVLPRAIDLEPTNHRRIAPRLDLFLTCRQVHEEAYKVFYSRNTFRLFPTHYRFIHTKWPLLSRIPPRSPAAIPTMQLRLGPAWTDPPKGWVVNRRLGLSDATGIRQLKIFVECDPDAHDVFRGFRLMDGFYSQFSRNLLKHILLQVPSVIEVQLDGYPSVKGGPLMRELLRETKANNRKIVWGALKDWPQGHPADIVVSFGGLRISGQLAGRASG